MISSVNFSIRVVMLGAIDVQSAEVSIGFETIGTAAMGSVGILIGVMAVEVIVIDWKSGDGLTRILGKLAKDNLDESLA